MTDPRFIDDRRLSDPVVRHDESGGVWSWVALASVLLLVGFLILAGSQNNSNTASSGSSPPTTASRTATPPSTTGSGSSSPQPITPAPSKSDTQ
jgi:ABC-type phosphate transport system substrate-binding protein